MPFNPFSALTSKIFGGASIVLLIALAVMGWRLHGVTAQRDTLRQWQADVTQAARDAAHQPKLTEPNVAQQVRNLGYGLDQVRTAMAEVRAKALADKMAADKRNEDRRRNSDNALHESLIDSRRRSDAYAATHSVRRSAGAPPVDRGDDGRHDLPEPAFGAPVADGPGGDAFVAVSRADYNLCTVNSTRLMNAHDWALDKLPPETTPERN